MQTGPPVIGVFDSGIGGLSVVRELDALNLKHPLLYVADQAHTPYGYLEKSQVRIFSEGITKFLREYGAAFIVVACNTASAAALYYLRKQYPDTTFVGMEPAIKPAAEKTVTGHVAVLATSITFQGELYSRLVKRYARNIHIETVACPELVEMVERGEINTPLTRRSLEKIIEPLLDDSVDQFVLGCSHFSFLKPVIQNIVGQRAGILDPAKAVAAQTERVLTNSNTACLHEYSRADKETENNRDEFYTTGERDSLQQMISEVLPEKRPARIRNLRWHEAALLRI